MIATECELRASQYATVQDELEETERTIKQYKQKQAMFRAQGQTRQLIEAQRAQQANIKIKESLEKARNEGEKTKHGTNEMELTNDAIRRFVGLWCL